MFTIEQIKAAHAKVKSGADFPAYIQEIKALGVMSYDNYVADGHTNYNGDKNFSISSVPKYATMKVADNPSIQKLQTELKIHQQGQTDYPTFCLQAAESGVEKWTVDIIKMTCTYYDKKGLEMLAEKIPMA